MQVADGKTVLGDFNDARFRKGEVESIFFRRDGKFWVRTDGPGGALADFEIKYTFGLYPLQQYMLEFLGAGFRLSGSPGTPVPRIKAGNAGSTFIPTANWRRAIRCIGRVSTRTGISSARDAIPPT